MGIRVPREIFFFFSLFRIASGVIQIYFENILDDGMLGIIGWSMILCLSAPSMNVRTIVNTIQALGKKSLFGKNCSDAVLRGPFSSGGYSI